jgi:tetratricopeptide (TPR) repeat protein
MKLERYSDAIESFKKALKINPDYQEVKYKIACCYALKGNVKQTLSTLKEAIAIDGKYLEVAKNDPCLCSIRKDRRFNHFLSNLH